MPLARLRNWVVEQLILFIEQVQKAQLYHLLVDICIYVIFKNRVGVLYRDLKHKVIAECFRPDKARSASFLNVL